MKNLRNLTIMSAVCLMLTGTISALPTAAATMQLQPPISGTCGDLEWAYDTTTETLTILGEGEMEKDVTGHFPWVNYKHIAKTVVLEEGVTSIIDGAFADFVSLELVHIPASVTSIADTAFAGCSGLHKVTGYDNTAAQLFAETNGLEFISGGDVPQQGTGGKEEHTVNWSYNQTAHWLALSGTGTLDAESAVSTKWGQFSDDAVGIVILEGITSLADAVFADFVKLEEITIPASVTEISETAFSGCTALTSIIGYDNTAAQIYAEANGLEFVSRGEAPAASGTCGKHLTWEFDAESGTLSISGTGAMTSWLPPDMGSSEPDVLLYTERPWNDLADAVRTVEIGAGVTEIGRSAFYGFTALETVNISDSVTEIGAQAFDGCIRLTEITLPASVARIDKCAFFNIRGLETVTVLNPACEFVCDGYNELIFGLNIAIFRPILLRGYANSTAQTYAKKFNYNFEEIGELPAPLRGDADGDGEITAEDAQLVLSAYLETLMERPLPLETPYADAADVDRNGTVNSVDAQYILRYYLDNTVLHNPVAWEELIHPDVLLPDCMEEPLS